MQKEVEIRFKFIDFLIEEKNYPSDSLVHEYSMQSGKGRFYRANLVILDSVEKEIIGLIEFKNRLNNEIIRDALHQVKSYLSALNKSEMPTFLVGLDDNDEFAIYILSEDEWVQIDKENFPTFKALATSIFASNRLRDLENKKELENQLRKSQSIKAIASWLSIMVAIIGLILSIYWGGGKISRTSDLDIKNRKLMLTIDSLNSTIDNNTIQTLKAIEDYQNFIVIVDSVRSDSIEEQIMQKYEYYKLESKIFKLQQSYDSISNEYKKLLITLSDDPMKIVEINNIKSDITLLESDFEHGLELVSKEISSLDEKYNFIIGGIITIIAAILILALPNLINGFRNKSTKS